MIRLCLLIIYNTCPFYARPSFFSCRPARIQRAGLAKKKKARQLCPECLGTFFFIKAKLTKKKKAKNKNPTGHAYTLKYWEL